MLLEAQLEKQLDEGLSEEMEQVLCISWSNLSIIIIISASAEMAAIGPMGQIGLR